MRGKTQQCWDVFISIQLLCLLNEALECHINETKTEMDSFVCVCLIGDLGIGRDLEGITFGNQWLGLVVKESPHIHSLKSLNKNLSFI